MSAMQIEDCHADVWDGPYVADLDELWLYWSSVPPGLAGRERRRALFASFASALQYRWSHGGYRFRFVEEVRRPGATAKDDTGKARALLQAMFPGLRGETFEITWCEPGDALDEFLDHWLFFRRHRPYVRQDDVPQWMMPVLCEPWAAGVRELVGEAPDVRAAVIVGENLTDGWGDHGVALVLAAAGRLCAFQVGLWTD